MAAPNLRQYNRGILQSTIDFCVEKPVAAAAIAAGVASVGFVLYKALVPGDVFAAPVDSENRHLAEDPSMNADLAAVAETLIELGATGLFTAEEGAVLSREFLDLSDGVPRLDRAACGAVFERIGVKDRVIADRIFNVWDVDGTGSIDMKEFLHALVLVLQGSHHDKIDMSFTIMDMDNDGRVSKPEMLRFLKTVNALNAEKQSAYELQKQVDAMFASIKTQVYGFLSRSEFQELASQKKFHLGAKLESFMTNLQKKFSASMASAAEPQSRGGVPLMRTPSTDNSGEYAEYNALREKAKELPSPHSPVVSPSAGLH